MRAWCSIWPLQTRIPGKPRSAIKQGRYRELIHPLPPSAPTLFPEWGFASLQVFWELRGHCEMIENVYMSDQRGEWDGLRLHGQDFFEFQ
jgi:hypothetical protein